MSASAARSQQAVDAIRSVAQPLERKEDLDVLMQRIGDSRFVLLGEASHGTHEYYVWRAKISKRLIEEKGFNFIAVEGDWPDCYEINRFVKSYSGAKPDVVDVLSTFRRWPTWMWGNWEIGAFAQWMRQHNSQLPKDKRAGFYGLDVYSLMESLEAIQHYLKSHDGGRAQASAANALRCFEKVMFRGREDLVQAYGMATSLTPYSCLKEVTDLLANMRKEALKKAQGADEEAMENAFAAEQNAFVAMGAEEYYRVMMQGNAESWNTRDKHMMGTLERLVNFYGPNSKAIVWAHNTHIGDARFTSMKEEGEWNLGQLVRERYGEDTTVLVGFGSYQGSVLAGRSWGAKMEKMRLPPGKPGSWEEACHRATKDQDMMIFSDQLGNTPAFTQRIGNRAVGVVYHPEYEEYGNYVPSVIPRRYNVFIHLDATHALHALGLKADPKEVPETFPFGV